MLGNGWLENFDQLQALAFKPEAGPTEAQVRGSVKSLSEGLSLTEEALINYQSWFKRSTRFPFRVVFPFARYLRKGGKVYNLTTGEEYIIKEKISVDQNVLPDIQDSVVELSGNVPPANTDRLRLDREMLVNFHEAYPKSFVSSYKFSGGALTADMNAGPWKDTVTYLVVHGTPGGMGSRFFGSPAESKHRFRRNIETTDPGFMAEQFGKVEDNLIQFDCWAQSNSDATDILDWFKIFMELYIGVLKWNGIQDIRYWDRGVDELVTRWRSDIVNRTIRYVYRVESIYSVIQRKISSVDIYVSLTGLPRYEDQVVGLPTGETISFTHS